MEKEIPPFFPAPKCSFIVQFAWQPRFNEDGGAKAGGILPVPEPEATGSDAPLDAAVTGAETAG